MNRLVVDLDGTLTRPDESRSYGEKEPNLPVIARLREYQAAGFEIVVQTSRQMRTYDNCIGKINAHTLPIIIDWLQRHHVPYDEIYVGKPWCGTDGFYVDDHAVRPAEFVSMSMEQIQALIRSKD
jgi:capsule biosynthesis phosphatase